MFQAPAVIHPYSYIDSHRKIEVHYPVVIGGTSAASQQLMNRTIMAALNQLLRERSLYEPSLVELNGWFEIKNNQRGILSLALYVYSYTGGAHGMTTIKTMTFDLFTGKLFSLNDFFKSNSDYQDELLNRIKLQVKERDIPVIEEPITFPGQNNFYLSDKTLVLYYQLYDLAPYYYGIVYFPINIYSIQNILNENSPLGKMIN